MTELTLQRLKAAGWTPGRKVDITPIEEAYADAGMQIPDKLREFFEEFGFLTFSWGKKENLTDERHVIDPRMELQYLSKKQFEHCFEDYGIIGTAYPVGSAYRDNMDILYHGDGNFYLFMSPDPLIRCGNTIKGFIDGLLGGDDSGWETLDE